MKPREKFVNKVKGAERCPECGDLVIGKPELKQNETSGVRWFVYTHPGKFCRKFIGGERKGEA